MTVSCRQDVVRAILNRTAGGGLNPAALRVGVREGSFVYNGWTLIRHEGKVYLRGYTPLINKLQPGIVPRLSLYNCEGVGELQRTQGEAVTVPLDHARWKDGRNSNGWGEITLANVQADTHFREDW